MVIFLAGTDLRAGYQVPVGAGALCCWGVAPRSGDPLPAQQLHLLLVGADPPNTCTCCWGGQTPPPTLALAAEVGQTLLVPVKKK